MKSKGFKLTWFGVLLELVSSLQVSLLELKEWLKAILTGSFPIEVSKRQKKKILYSRACSPLEQARGRICKFVSLLKLKERINKIVYLRWRLSKQAKHQICKSVSLLKFKKWWKKCYTYGMLSVKVSKTIKFVGLSPYWNSKIEWNVILMRMLPIEASKTIKFTGLSPSWNSRNDE